MSLQVVLLMAGRGSRFTREGWTQSKPLIEVHGAPMFVQALAGLAGLEPVTLYTVVRQDQIEQERILDTIHAHRPDAVAVVVPEVTPGAAFSALAAVQDLERSEPVLVLDCDLRFASADYVRAVSTAPGRGIDGVLLSFASDDPRYSYAERGVDGFVTRVAEKQVISTDAIAGAYYIASAALLRSAIETAARELRPAADRELYMSDVIGELLGRGARFVVATVDEYESYGTPEELAESIGPRR